MMRTEAAAREHLAELTALWQRQINLLLSQARQGGQSLADLRDRADEQRELAVAAGQTEARVEEIRWLLSQEEEAGE